MARMEHVERRCQLILAILRDSGERLTTAEICQRLPVTESAPWGIQEITYGNVYQNLRQLHREGWLNRIAVTRYHPRWSSAITTAELATFDELVADYGKELSE